MGQYLTWTKGIFDSSYQIFADGKIRNTLFFNTWKNEARGIGQDKSYYFKTSGLFNGHTQILNENNEIIGTIAYQSLKSNAMLTMTTGEQYMWQHTNNWHSRWEISNREDILISYTSSTSSGTIETNTDDELLLICGLFVREYYMRSFIFLLFIVFIPIICSNSF